MVKPGRNDPCHCGSGRKYKKCCYARDCEASARDRHALPNEPKLPWRPCPESGRRTGATCPERAPLPEFDLLAVDPGLHTGWAAFAASGGVGGALSLGGDLVACGLGDPPCESAPSLVIEVPQVYPRQRVPPNDLITLAFQAGRYAGRAAGEVHEVRPHQWKGNLPKDVCEARVRAALSEAERAVLDAARAPAGHRHDVADAVGIGLFFLCRFR